MAILFVSNFLLLVLLLLSSVSRSIARSLFSKEEDTGVTFNYNRFAMGQKDSITSALQSVELHSVRRTKKERNLPPVSVLSVLRLLLLSFFLKQNCSQDQLVTLRSNDPSY